MKLRELGISREMEERLDIMKAPKCECGCGGSANIVVGNEKVGQIVANLVAGYDCPKALGLLHKNKKTYLFFREDMIGDEYEDTIVSAVIKSKSNQQMEVKRFIKENKIEHLVALNYIVKNGEPMLEVVDK